MRTHIVRGTTAAVLALTLGLAAAACGDDEQADRPSGTSTAPNGDVFNDADVEFASDMIQHHAQAVQMVVMTQGRSLDPEFQQLTEQIRAAQVPEIETMSDWLTAWGEEVPPTSLDHANAGHDMDDMSESMEDMDMGDMPGAMTADDLDDLENAAASAFEEMWLEMMIEHHEGAVEMAQDEQEDGANPAAQDLAATIIETQEAEIETMERMLDELP